MGPGRRPQRNARRLAPERGSRETSAAAARLARSTAVASGVGSARTTANRRSPASTGRTPAGAGEHRSLHLGHQLGDGVLGIVGVQQNRAFLVGVQLRDAGSHTLALGYDSGLPLELLQQPSALRLAALAGPAAATAAACAATDASAARSAPGKPPSSANGAVVDGWGGADVWASAATPNRIPVSAPMSRAICTRWRDSPVDVACKAPRSYYARRLEPSIGYDPAREFTARFARRMRRRRLPRTRAQDRAQGLT